MPTKSMEKIDYIWIPTLLRRMGTGIEEKNDNNSNKGEQSAKLYVTATTI